MLEIKEVSLMKGKVRILKQVSCQIGQGEITVLLGKSGSGKTSFLRCLAQIESSYEGTIVLDGQSLVDLPPKQRGKAIGFVPQTYALFPHMNVLENCSFPLQIIHGLTKKEAAVKAKEILSLLDMVPWIEAHPQTLSGGQQQRVAIARAIASNALFLFLDEPTSALDPENVDRLITILNCLKKQKKGIVIASQDMDFAFKVSDRILLMEEGMVVETATKEEFKNSLSGKIGELLARSRSVL